MKYGLTIFPTDYSIHPAELAVAAEERGFESLWVPEHSHFPVSPFTPGTKRGRPRSDVLRRDGSLRGARDGGPGHA